MKSFSELANSNSRLPSYDTPLLLLASVARRRGRQEVQRQKLGQTEALEAHHKVSVEEANDLV